MLEAATKGGSSYILIIYVLVFGALYFFYLRPRSKRQKAARTVQKKVDVGERAQINTMIAEAVAHLKTFA